MSKLSPPPATGNVEFDRWFFLLYKSLADAAAIMPVTADASVRPVPYGGTGASSLSGYLRGNGSNPFTSVNQIPVTDISGLVQSRVYGTQVDALDQISAAGIYAITAYGSSAVRTMTGTTGRLSIANGNGVSGNPTFNIDTAYTGQATITTLGAVTTGTWNAGAVTSSGPVSATQSILTNGANNGVTQHIPLKRDTADAVATELTTDGAAGSGATNRIAVPTNTALSVVVNICAKVSGSANSKQMLRQFLIVNNAGTTSIQGAVTALGTDVGSAALTTASTTITANAVDNCVKIEVAGIAATNIRWTANVVSTAVLYP